MRKNSIIFNPGFRRVTVTYSTSFLHIHEGIDGKSKFGKTTYRITERQKTKEALLVSLTKQYRGDGIESIPVLCTKSSERKPYHHT